MNFLSNQRRKKVRYQYMYYYICFGWFIGISAQFITPKIPSFPTTLILCIYFISWRRYDDFCVQLWKASILEWSPIAKQATSLIFRSGCTSLACSMVKKFLCRGNLIGTETRAELTFLMETSLCFPEWNYNNS